MMDSKLKMVKSKDGKMVPAFAADGKGKMAKGGMAAKTPAKAKMKMKMGGYAKGGMSKKGMC
jgi:hypothetical protein